MRWRFILPLPPSVNQAYIERGGRRVLSREARHYKAVVGKALRGICSSPEFQTVSVGGDATLFPPLLTPTRAFLRLNLTFYFPTAQRRDLDNGLKLVQDLICDALGVDDRCVVEVRLMKRVDKKAPRLEMEVEALSAWPFEEPPSSPPLPTFDIRPHFKPLPPRSSRPTKEPFRLDEWLKAHEVGD